jgi:autotransporter-associated beta strand protein
MVLSFWRRWLPRPSRSSRRAAARRPGTHLRLEALEDRLTPAMHTWTGASSSTVNWSDPTNWSGGAPAANETNVVLNFGAAGALQKANTDDIAGLVVTQFNFTDAGYTLSATQGLTLTGGISDTSANPGNTILPVNKIAANMTLSGNVVVQVADPARDLVLSGILDGLGGLTKLGAGALDLASPEGNNYTGATAALQGVLNLDDFLQVVGPLVVGDGVGGPNADQVFLRASNATGSNVAVTVTASGELVLGDGNLSPAFEAIGSLDMTGGEILGTPGSSQGQASLLTLFGNVTTHPAATPARIDANLSLGGAPRTFNVADGPADPDLLITGVISDGFSSASAGVTPKAQPSVMGTKTMSLTKAGTGTLLLTGNNVYTGTTTVAGGTLLVDGSQPSSDVVVNGGTLGGHGTVGNTTVSSGAVSPEETDTGIPARLTVSGNFALGAGGTFLAHLAGDAPGTGYSQLRVTGTVSLAGGLVLTGAIPANDTTPFTILDNAGSLPVQGTFQGHPEGGLLPNAGVCVQVTYQGGDGNNVVLQGVGDDYLFVRGVYHGLALPIDNAKIAAYVRQLQAHQTTRRDVATAIWNSPEHRQVEVALFYQAFGEPTNDGKFDKYVRELESGTPEGTVLTQLLTSKGLVSRNHKRATYVRLLFRMLTGTDASRKELHRMLAVLAGGRAQFVLKLLSSPPVYLEGLTEHFVSFLGRTPTRADLAFFLDKLATGERTPLDLMLDVVTGSPTATPNTPVDYAKEFLIFLRNNCARI